MLPQLPLRFNDPGFQPRDQLAQLCVLHFQLHDPFGQTHTHGLPDHARTVADLRALRAINRHEQLPFRYVRTQFGGRGDRVPNDG